MNIRATMHKSLRLRFLLPSTCCLFLAFTGLSAFAAASDCVEDDPVNGRFICLAEQPNPWWISGCPNTADFLSEQRAGCEATGGTFQNPDCPGGHAATEEEMTTLSVSFMEHLSGGSCSIASDSGWNATFDGTNFCYGGLGQKFQDGWLVGDSRHIVVSCSSGSWPTGAEDLRWSKSRTLGCPFGSTQRSVTRNGVSVTACTIPVECPTCNHIGNPVTAAAGTKVETETDYRGAGGLVFTRYYQSWSFPDLFTLTPDGHSQLQLGYTWRSNFDKRVIPVGNTPGIYALTFPDGHIQYFDTLGAEIFNYNDGRASLATLSGGGYVYQGPDVVETYRADGRLQTITRRSGETLTLAYSSGGVFVDRSGNPTGDALPPNLLIGVTDSYGNALSFAYSAPGKLVAMTDPSGGRTLYTYDFPAPNYNLASVTYPDGHARSYRYTESLNPVNYLHALTSIVDENGSLYGTFKYDANGRILSSEHALGAQRYQFIRPDATTTNVTDPLGTARTYTFQVVDGITRMTANSLTGGAGFGVGIQNQTYDATGNLLSKTDFNNTTTCYAYDTARNLETVRVEGIASAASCSNVVGAGAALPAGSRKILTTWHPRWRLPASTSEPNRRTIFVYNGDASCAPASAVIADGSANGQPIGVLCTKTVQSTNDADGSQGFAASLQGQPRIWNYAYDAHGHVLSADGPRIDASDITATAYYADDDPDFGKRGNVATITNALGHATSITAYNAHGQLLTIVDPNGLTTTLGYDPRQRLVSRSVGGEITTYTYDNAGQLTLVTLPDSSSLTYTYDAAHRMTGMSDNLGNRIAYTLDAMGNRTQEQVFDPANALAQTRSRVYNSLNRLFQELGAQNQTTEHGYDDQGNVTSVKDPLNHITSNQYDALKQVTDPRSLVTGYTVDGLGNLTQQASPDTGTTTNAYDAAGNLLTQTDAKGQITTYAYDALNRVTLITFHDGSKQAYAYDQGTNGIGRLSSITETDPANAQTSLIAYAYEPHGRVTSETRTVGGVPYVLGYSYDSSGRLTGITYPSGRTVTYGFDALGRVNQVSTTKDSQSQVVVQNVQYQPFGGVKSYTLGNGQSYTRSIDQDGRIASYTLGSQSFGIGYDAASRIEFIAELGAPANSNTYGYDNFDRLTSAVLPSTPFAYSYDALGNRLSKTVGSGTEGYTYSTTSNRLATLTPISGPTRSFAFDANGSTTADGNNTYAYDTRGRMVQATSVIGATTYQVNVLGQRIRKTNTQTDRLFHYDTRGRLIAETDPAGSVKRELFYLGDIPVAVFQ